VPVDVVLCQMGEASLSSARAGLDQFDRTCQAEQERHIAEATAPIDRAAIADAEVAGELMLPDDVVIDDALAAKYARPPKYSTDRKKDAETIAALRAAGVSGTTAFAMFGLVYEDERELTAIEAEFDAAQKTSEPGQPATPAPAPAQTAAPATEGQTAPAATWWRRAIARISGHRTAA
jgi:capsid protein